MHREGCRPARWEALERQVAESRAGRPGWAVIGCAAVLCPENPATTYLAGPSLGQYSHVDTPSRAARPRVTTEAVSANDDFGLARLDDFKDRLKSAAGSYRAADLPRNGRPVDYGGSQPAPSEGGTLSNLTRIGSPTLASRVQPELPSPNTKSG